MRTAIIGGGAAGFFLAINLKQMVPEMEVTILEKAGKVLRKVEISGGGRCNCTNSFAGIDDLSTVYPRGHRLMKRLFKAFSHEDAFEWFEHRGVRLITQEDECVFPASQDSHSIINCFLGEAKRMGITIRTSCGVEKMERREGDKPGMILTTRNGEEEFDFVAVTTGGSPIRSGLQWLENLGHDIERPVPSLFTFSINDKPLRKLMGTVVENAIASIPGTKFRSSGPLLITHWGMSGPCILRLSSYAARHLNENDYRAPLLVNWTGCTSTEEIAAFINTVIEKNRNKYLSSVRPYDLPQRLWLHLLAKAGMTADRRWGELGKKGVNKLADTLSNDSYAIEGKSAFREEFVTCGGVSLNSINKTSMESKACLRLYFAGEVLDIDAVTGGFNFQAAWTTAFVAAQSIACTAAAT